VLQDIGEEFVEFLEKELNISDDEGGRASSSHTSSARNRNQDTRERSSRTRTKSNSNWEESSDERAKKAENDLAEIEDMLAQLKKEIGQ
jgi:hypothetical protein